MNPREASLRWRVGLDIIHKYARALGVTVHAQEYPKRVRTGRWHWSECREAHGRPRYSLVWEIDFSGRGRGWVRNNFGPLNEGDLAYNHRRREVIWVTDRKRAESPNLIFSLLHEVTHARWGHCRDAEHEWACGMIPWELAWIDRLVRDERVGATQPKIEAIDALDKGWRAYASAGTPRQKAVTRAERRARRVVETKGLPDPWAPGAPR